MFNLFDCVITIRPTAFCNMDGELKMQPVEHESNRIMLLFSFLGHNQTALETTEINPNVWLIISGSTMFPLVVLITQNVESLSFSTREECP